MGKRMPLFVWILFSLFIFSACQNSGEHQVEGSTDDYEDDKMVGNVWEINKKDNSVVVDISDWMKRDSKGPTTDIGYSYTVKISEETVMKHENGTKASFDEIKIGQKMQMNLPNENNFEVPPEEIVLVEMTYEEKYARLLSHIEGFNIVLMYEHGEYFSGTMLETVYTKIMSILKDTEHTAVAASIEYNADFIVDYKEELDIEQLPVFLVFDQEEFLFKTYDVDELYNFFRKMKE